MTRRRSVGSDPVRVAVGGDEHVAGEDRAALRLDDEPAVGLAPDRPGADALVQVGAGAAAAAASPAK